MDSMPAVTISPDKSIKKFTYMGIKYPLDMLTRGDEEENSETGRSIPEALLNKYLEIIGREIVREEIPSLTEIEKKLQIRREDLPLSQLENKTSRHNVEGSGHTNSQAFTIIAELERKGYLKDSSRWLSKKGFLAVGERLLHDVMKALDKGDIGIHETMHIGSGSVILDSSHKYEVGNDIRLINVSRSILNAVERISKSKQKMKI